MAITPPSAGTPAEPACSGATANQQTRSPRKPLAPLHPDNTSGPASADADPQQDVAPNLGGEEQMQDA